MNQYQKKLVGVVCLCMCGIILSIVMGVWIYEKNAGEASHQPTKISWANRVHIDERTEYPIMEVLDGDTVKTVIEGHAITIRLLGIDTPEVVDPRKPVQCYGPEASAETKSLLIGKSVLIALNPDYERTDKYGRLLAYVRLNGSSVDESVSTSSEELFLNEYLVREGYAREYTFNTKHPYQYQQQFKNDELKAQKAGKGLWGKCVSVNGLLNK